MIVKRAREALMRIRCRGRQTRRRERSLARARELYDNAARSLSPSLCENATRNYRDALAVIRSLAINARVVVQGEATEGEHTPAVEALRKAVMP